MDGDLDKIYVQALEAVQRSDCPVAIASLTRIINTQIPNRQSNFVDIGGVKETIGKAQSLLGHLYYDGECVVRNYEDAYRLMTRSLRVSKSFTTNYALGNMYLRGLGIPRNFQLARKHLLESAAYIFDSTILLSVIYEIGGYGVEKDLVNSYMWLNTGLSHFQSFGFTSQTKNQLYSRLNSIEKRLSPGELRMAQEFSQRCEHAFFKDGIMRYREDAVSVCEQR